MTLNCTQHQLTREMVERITTDPNDIKELRLENPELFWKIANSPAGEDALNVLSEQLLR